MLTSHHQFTVMATRIDLEFVLMKDLTQMQAKLNQWHTKGELVKFETQVVESGVFFKILRKKGE